MGLHTLGGAGYFPHRIAFISRSSSLVDNGSSLGRVRRPTEGGGGRASAETGWEEIGLEDMLEKKKLTSRYTPSSFILTKHFPDTLLTLSSIQADQSHEPRGIS